MITLQAAHAGQKWSLRCAGCALRTRSTQGFCHNILIVYPPVAHHHLLGSDNLETRTFVEPQRRHLIDIDTKPGRLDRKSTRMNSSYVKIMYDVFCLITINK